MGSEVVFAGLIVLSLCIIVFALCSRCLQPPARNFRAENDIEFDVDNTKTWVGNDIETGSFNRSRTDWGQSRANGLRTTPRGIKAKAKKGTWFGALRRGKRANRSRARRGEQVRDASSDEE